MASGAKKLIGWGYVALAIGLTLITVLVLLLRILLPTIDQYRDDLTAYLADRYAVNLQLESLNGRLSGRSLHLEAKQLAVVAPDQGIELLQLDQLSLQLDLVQSLWQGHPVFRQLQLSKPALVFNTAVLSSSSGSTEVSQASAPAFPLWLLSQPLAVQQGSLRVLLPDEQYMGLTDITVKLAESSAMYQLQLLANLDGQTDKPLRLLVEGQGDPTKDQVNIYAYADSLPVSLLNSYLPAEYRLQQLEIEQQYWLTVKAGRVQRMQGLIDVDTLRINEQLDFSDSRVVLSMLRTGLNTRQLQIRELQLSSANKSVELPGMAVNWRIAGDGNWWPSQLLMETLSLQPVTSWLQQQPWLPKGANEALLGLAPAGELHNLQVNWRSTALDDLQLDADLNRVEVKAWDDIPKLAGVDGRLEANLQQGKIHLNSQQFEMHFPELFPQQWQYQQADGVIGWRLEDDAAVVNSELLHLRQPEIEAHGRFSLRIPYSSDKQTDLTLMIGTSSADATVTGSYVPPLEVGQELYDWLVGAIGQGQVREGGFLLNGGTRSRLDDYQMPTVQLFFDVDKAGFAYQPGWPALKADSVSLLIKDESLVVDAWDGRIFDSAVEHAWIYMPPSGDQLFVQGQIQGDAKDIQRLLHESPLKEEVGDGLDGWQLSGQADSNLSLVIPLDEKNDVDVHVASSLKNGRFNSQALDLDFTKLQGTVRYDTPLGLSAKKITGSLLGHQVSGVISSEAMDSKPKSTKTVVQLDSRINIDEVRDWLKLPLLSIAKGETWYRARVNICPSVDGCSGFDLRTQLQGVTVDGPEVLAKTADDKRLLHVTAGLSEQVPLSVRYGDAFASEFSLLNGEVQAGVLGFNADSLDMAEVGTLSITGQLASLEFDRLQQLLAVSGLLDKTSQAAQTPTDQASSLGADGDKAELSLQPNVNLQIGQFSMDGLQIDNLSAQLAAAQQGLNLTLRASNFDGSILFPDDGSPYRVDIARLHLPERDGDESGEGEQSLAPSPVDPQSLPAAIVSIDNLRLGDKAMGQWQFSLQPDDEGATVEGLQGKVHGFALTGQIRWQAGVEQASALTLKVDGKDVADVLEGWGYGRSMESDVFKAYLQLNWPGAPWQFALASSNGAADFVTKQGRIVESGASTALLRLFGILNLNAITRRLRLDFSDLFLKGVAFDRIEGDYRIENGVAHTRKPFVMTGPSVDMRLQGELDLVNETLDQTMDVTLPVTSNLPIMSVLLGQPQIAGAVFLIDKLIGDKLEKFTTLKYRLQGSWLEPEVNVPPVNKAITPNAPMLPEGQP